MTVLDPSLKPRTVTDFKNSLPRIGDQNDFDLDDEHEFILCHMPMALTGPNARRQTQQIHAEIAKPRLEPQTLAYPLCAWGVEGCRIPRPRASGHAFQINS